MKKINDAVREIPVAENKQVQLRINVVDHYIKSVSFDNNRSEITAKETKPEIKLDVNVEVLQKNETQYEVCLIFRAEVLAGDIKIFSLNLNYAGLCILTENTDTSQRDHILNIFCPNIIFPFARRLIAEITRDGGLQPMLINHVDFASLYKQQLTQT